MLGKLRSNRLLDQISVLFSGLCILHCAALPVLLVTVPAAGTLTGSDQHFHSLMLLLIIPISAVALAAGYRHHRCRRVIGSGTAGVLLLVIAATIAHAYLGAATEVLLTLAGSAALAHAHIRNMRLCRLPVKIFPAC